MLAAAQARRPTASVAQVWAQHKHLPSFDAVRRAAADTFEVLPAQLSAQHKNPCWSHPSGEGKLRCLPYFQILGVSKCGTTDLYQRMVQHPDILNCGYKGPHFWDENMYPPPAERPAPNDFNWYVNIFSKAAEVMARQPGAVTGEASSNTFTGVYTYLRGRQTAARQVNASLAEYLFEAQPYLRAIVVLRNPVDRFYSAFHYYRPRNLPPPSPQLFHTRALQAVSAWERCVAQRGELACLRSYTPEQLVKGMYAAFAPAWLQVYPREQLLFIRNEDYQAEPRGHLEAVFSFLGVDQDLPPELWDKVLKRQNANSQRQRYSPMLAETRALLHAFYTPFNRRLAELLGNPRWRWEGDAAAGGGSSNSTMS